MEWDELERRLGGTAAPAPAPPEEQVSRPPRPTADVQRALRLDQLFSDSVDSIASYKTGEAIASGDHAPGVARLLESRRQDVAHDLGATGAGAPPLFPQRTRAAIERELWRRGALGSRTGALAAEAIAKRLEGSSDNASLDLDAMLEREQRAIEQADQQQELADPRLQAARGMASLPDPNQPTRPYAPEHNPLLYPVRAVDTAFRAPRSLLQLPFTAAYDATGFEAMPFVAPSFRLAKMQGQDPWTAYLAASDPLGRFSPAGAQGPAWTNDGASYQDVMEKALPQLTPAGRVLLGLPLDILNDPLSFTAFPAAGRPAQIFGSTRLASGLESGLAAAGRRVSAGMTSLRNASPEVDSFIKFLKRGKTALEEATWDKYAGLKDLGEPGARATAILEFGENNARVDANRAQQAIEGIFHGDRQLARDVRDYIEDPTKFSPVGVSREPYVARPERLALPAPEQPLLPGEVRAPPPDSPNVRFGAEQASPTAVPGTPDAARYGPLPGWSQARDLTPEAEVAVSKVKELNDRLAEEQAKRGLLGGYREGWFPHEQSAETIADLASARGAAGPAARDIHATGFPHQKRRQMVEWLNGLIEQENAERVARAAKEGQTLGPDALLQPLKDTTVDVNAFMAKTPEAIRQRIDRMGAGQLFREQPEFFVDKPQEVLTRAHRRGAKAVNDYDTMEHLAVLKDAEGNPVAMGNAVEKNGRVYVRRPIDRTPPTEPAGPLARRDAAAGKVVTPPEGAGPLATERTGAYGQPKRLTGEVPPTFPAGEVPNEQLVELPGYRIPTNPDFRRFWPEVAVPAEIAKHIDKMTEPYWRTKGFAGIFERYFLRPVGHTGQQWWKTAATVARLPFALRNYYSQQIMNTAEYGARVNKPWVQGTSHWMAMPQSYFDNHPDVLSRKVTINGQTYTWGELREVAERSGLWRNLRHGIDVKSLGPEEMPLHSSLSNQSRVSEALDKVTGAIGPVNPFSEEFVLTKHAFAPMAEFFERQGRMAAMLMELEDGRGLVDAAVRANKVHVNYGRYGKDFEKYVGAMYPFGKWTLAQALNYPERLLRRPGPAQLPNRLLDAGRHMVPEEERRRFQQEPLGGMAAQMGAEQVGFPGVGAIKEPEAGLAKGPGRLPFLTAPPEASVTALNWWGAVPRILAADDKAKAIGQEVVEGAFPVPKALYEHVTGQNVWTGETIDPDEAVPAPRLMSAAATAWPEWMQRNFAIERVDDPTRRDQGFWATPRSTAQWWRMLPNVQMMDLALGTSGVEGTERPYDDRFALLLRNLGLTQLLHDPLRTAGEEARDRAKSARRYEEKAVGSWGVRPKKQKTEPR